jgi:hypothetical protein
MPYQKYQGPAIVVYMIHNFKILGPPVDDCTWTGWIDNDNPLRHCDCESPPDGCLVQDYQIKDISTGTIYILGH